MIRDGDLGPCMRLLNDRQRQFVMYLVESGTGNATDAARKAGYFKESENGLRVQAHALTHDAKVLAAIKEECERNLRADLPVYVAAMRHIALDKGHRQQRQALETMMNRAGLREQSEVVHTVALDPEHLKAQITSMLQSLRGVDIHALIPSAKIIEHEPAD